MAVGFFEGAVVLLDSADSETQSYPILDEGKVTI